MYSPHIYLERMLLEGQAFDAYMLWLNINITDSLINNNHQLEQTREHNLSSFCEQIKLTKDLWLLHPSII